MEVEIPASEFDLSQVTQEIPSQPRSNWQAPYDEHYLNSAGTKILGDFLKKPEDAKNTRVVFFFYFLDNNRPLLTQFGKVNLSSISPMPSRLKSIIKFEPAD